MAKNFETVKKGTVLLLHGKFNKEEGEVTAYVTYVEIHGDEIRIAYKADTRKGNFNHTITVNKKSNTESVFVERRKWYNYEEKYNIQHEKSTRKWVINNGYRYSYYIKCCTN